jgi:LacI family transcriptional regulator
MKQASKARSTERPVTLKTLAAHLGLDPTTISVVLNDVPGRSIPNHTRERIKAAAQALGYSPNILLPDVASSYHAQILSGVVHHLAQFNYCCMILPHGDDASLVLKHADALIRRGAEGFIAIDTVFEYASHISTVAVGGQSHVAGTTVIQLNQRRAAVLALEFLESRGHRELLLIGSEDPDVRSSGLARMVLEMAPGYGLRIVCRGTASSAAEMADRFGAVLTLDGEAARIASRIFSAQKPGVSIVCIDNERNSVVDASVTVIRQPLRTMGQMAAEILMQKIRSDRPLPELITVEPEMVISTAGLVP